MASEATWSNRLPLRTRWACGCERCEKDLLTDINCDGGNCKREPSRRSAPQPPVGGHGFKVGDRVVTTVSSRAGEIIGFNSSGMAELLLDKPEPGIGGTRENPYTAWPDDQLRHLPPPTAQSDEGGGWTKVCSYHGAFRVKGCSQCDAIETPGSSADAATREDAERAPSGSPPNYSAQPPGGFCIYEPKEHGGPFIGACPHCVWAKVRCDNRSYRGSDVLELLAKQMAMLGRVTDDLQMLWLVCDQPEKRWHITDLRAEVSRLARPASERERGRGK